MNHSGLKLSNAPIVCHSPTGLHAIRLSFVTRVYVFPPPPFPIQHALSSKKSNLIANRKYGFLVAEVGYIAQHLGTDGFGGLPEVLGGVELKLALDAVLRLDIRGGGADELHNAVACLR